MRQRLLSTVLLLAAVAPGFAHANCLEGTSAHRCLQSNNAVNACTEALNLDSLDIGARRSLCEAHLQDKNFDSAAVVLQQGLDGCTGRSCRELELALSNVEEQRNRANRADPDAARREADAQRAYCMGPIANQRSIDACEKILISTPKDTEILISLGGKLNAKGQPAQAMIYLQRATRSGGDGPALKAEIAKAAPARAALAKECLRDTSLSTCEAALLPGARDEADIQRHRGKLLTALNRPTQARRALARSWSLKPRDPATARLISNLDQAAFRANKPAELLLLANAQSTLDNASAERETLRRILQFDPNHAEASARLSALAIASAPAIATTSPAQPDRAPQETAATRVAKSTPHVVEPEPEIVKAPEAAQPDERSVANRSAETSAPERTRRQSVAQPVATTTNATSPITTSPGQPEPPAAQRQILALNSIGADGRTH